MDLTSYCFKMSCKQVQSFFHVGRVRFIGCMSCFACKLKGGESFGRCAVNDDLAPILEEIKSTDAFILGSPIYFGDVTGEMRSFLERLLFPNPIYEPDVLSSLPKNIRTAWIYAMNETEELARKMGYERMFKNNGPFLSGYSGHVSRSCVTTRCSLTTTPNTPQNASTQRLKEGVMKRYSRRTASGPLSSA